MQFGTTQSEGRVHASPTAPLPHLPLVHTALWQWVPLPHAVPAAPVTQTFGKQNLDVHSEPLEQDAPSGFPGPRQVFDDWLHWPEAQSAPVLHVLPTLPSVQRPLVQ